MANSAEYEKAITAHNAAQAKYNPIRAAYHTKKIGDEEFLAARDAMKEADAAFDAAYAKESE